MSTSRFFKGWHRWLLAIVSLCLVIALGISTVPAIAQISVLPFPIPPFRGVISKSFINSKEDFPQPVKAPKNAPNIVLIMLDDIGFGQPSTFGGPLAMPYLDRLAQQGLKYNLFHTTAICSLTRAALLTGRNHHQVGTGTIMELSTGFPGYNSIWGRDNATIAEVLRQNGYSTAAFGKWHNTPDWETSPVGPFERWPTGLGFEYWYGFQGGETSQWEPQLFRNTIPVEPSATPEQGYHLEDDLATDAIAWMKRQKSIAPDRPFFLYFATGALHAPHHAPKEWIDKYKGQFDRGWDRYREEVLARQKQLGVVPPDTQLTPRPPQIAAWDSLSADEKRLYARQMEVFAGFASYTDYCTGRLIEAVQKLPDADNTLFIYIVGDNGPSAEGTLTGTTNNGMTQNGVPDNVESQLQVLDEIGGPKHENNYAVGWAWAGAAPFSWMKRVPSHLGGTRNGMVIVWPERIKDKGLRSQFHHVVDIAPTIYELVDIEFPESVNGVKQEPIAGTSLAYTFDNAKAEGRHRVQYFEVGGHRAIYQDGWMASVRHGVPWELSSSSGDFESDPWELYNLNEDFSQANDLAKKNPQKLQELKALFEQEAKKYDVYPLDDRFAERINNPNRPSVTRGRTTFRYAPGTTRIPEGSAPSIYHRSHRITVDLEMPSSGADGVLVAEGGSSAGYTLYVRDRKLIYEYNYFGKSRYAVTSNTPLPPGQLQVAVDYRQESKDKVGGGTATLFVNGQPVGEGKIARVAPVRFSATETLDVGMDLGATVSEVYHEQRPFPFTGSIEQVTFELK